VAWSGRAWFGCVFFNETKLGLARLGQAWLGMVCLGLGEVFMKLFIFRITGVSPILQRNAAAMEIQDKSKLTTQKNYEDQAERSTYRDEDGNLVMPSMAFRAAMLKAATGRKIGKASAKSIVSASIFPSEQHCVLLGKTGKPLTTYKIHRCRAVVQRQGVLRARPMIEDWRTDLALDIDTDMMPDITVVAQLLNIAGKIAGVGDWRPSQSGVFGRFTAELKR
jgi:hypothetical protein